MTTAAAGREGGPGEEGTSGDHSPPGPYGRLHLLPVPALRTPCSASARQAPTTRPLRGGRGAEHTNHGAEGGAGLLRPTAPTAQRVTCAASGSGVQLAHARCAPRTGGGD